MGLERRRVLFGEPERITGNAEQDALATALRAIEAREGERRGWDQPPRLFALHLADIDSGAIELRVVPPRLWAVPGHRNPADALAAFAARFPEPEAVGHLAFADSPGGFAGLAQMHEGWAAPDDAEESAEERARRAAGERTYKDRPDRLEVRLVIAVDINGHSYLLRRIRGGEAEMVSTAATDDRHISQARGRVPHALGRLVHAVRTGVLTLD
ncbi:hypothetical protein [Kitasatospora sp. GP82]|uniref:hypothetical protein n=1 Tax=Kitasatospora sp. GP82 TaxID=3035089 RepID=UPI0024747093|nr:hypothetical protein [Kitasatospora sp. GP82]MDH6130358.1 hypothetical protein [Kitasatospora sp. GP82]